MSEAGELYRSVVEPFWEHVDIYRGPEGFLRSFPRAPTEVGLLLATHAVVDRFEADVFAFWRVADEVVLGTHLEMPSVLNGRGEGSQTEGGGSSFRAS